MKKIIFSHCCRALDISRSGPYYHGPNLTKLDLCSGCAVAVPTAAPHSTSQTKNKNKTNLGGGTNRPRTAGRRREGRRRSLLEQRRRRAQEKMRTSRCSLPKNSISSPWSPRIFYHLGARARQRQEKATAFFDPKETRLRLLVGSIR
jgi:hypothetical protein